MSATRFDQIPEIARDWRNAGHKIAIATVVETWGSAPRPVGAQLVISDTAEMMGSVSGGCVEGAVVAEALDALEDGTPRILTYGVGDDDAFAVGLACGGTIRVMVEPVGIGQGIAPELIDALVAARAKRLPVAYVVDTETWSRTLEDGNDAGDRAQAVSQRFQADASGFETISGKQIFFGIHNPALRIAIVGGVHIAQALAPMARLAGYDVTIIDPRTAFASAARFPDFAVRHDWPDTALKAHGLDQRTALVTLTHDPKLDDPALTVALESEAFYIGALGSRRTHAKRVARLETAGFSTEDIARIHAPVGLNIGSRSPAEIAISVMAEITSRLRGPK